MLWCETDLALTRRGLHRYRVGPLVSSDESRTGSGGVTSHRPVTGGQEGTFRSGALGPRVREGDVGRGCLEPSVFLRLPRLGRSGSYCGLQVVRYWILRRVPRAVSVRVEPGWDERGSGRGRTPVRCHSRHLPPPVLFELFYGVISTPVLS